MTVRTGPPAGRRPDPTRRTAARAAARRAGTRTPPVRPGRQGVTTRAAVLGLVLCAVVLSAAVPLREFLAQRGEISTTEADQRARSARITTLESRQQQLEDPAYVERLARERFGYVMPGETAYVVLRPGSAQAPLAPSGEATPSGPARPWYGQLWSSVESADRAPR